MIVFSNKKIEKTGARVLFSGLINETDKNSANEKLKNKAFKNLFLKRNEIKMDNPKLVIKYKIQKIIRNLL